MNSSKVSKKSLTVDSALASFIENDVLEGLDIDPNKFWSNFEQFLKEYSLLANQFLKHEMTFNRKLINGISITKDTLMTKKSMNPF